MAPLRHVLPAFLLLSTAFAAPALGDPAAAKAEPAARSSDRVTSLFAQAQAAFAKGDKQGAYQAYQEAWSLQKSYDIAGNLANVELKLGKVRDAAEHLSYALDNFPPTGEPAQKAALQRKLEEAQREVGRVRIRVSVDGASVRINGKPVGVSPLAAEVYVEPVPLSVEATLNGYTSASQSISVAKGEQQEVTLTLAPIPDKPIGKEPAGRSLVPAFVIGGVGAVALTGGLVLIGLAESKRAEAKALSQETHHSCVVLDPSPQGKCKDLTAAAASGDALGNVGIGGLVVTGVAAAAVATYLLWPAPQGEVRTARSVRAVPVVSMHGGGLHVVGVF